MTDREVIAEARNDTRPWWVAAPVTGGAWDHLPTSPPDVMGWQCPRCCRCYAPSVEACPACQPPTMTSTTGTR